MICSIQPGAPLRGTVRCPGDKSISHRYAMLAALAEGTSELANFSASQDCESTLACLRSLGVEISAQGSSVSISGRGLRRLSPPATALDAGNSGTTMRLLAGILAGQPFHSVLQGDTSLSRRPMSRIIEPLRLMGAKIDSRAGGFAPLSIRGGVLHAVRCLLPVPSAQVKSCILLAGLFADGITAVQERIKTRDHTEIALQQFGAAVRRQGDWIEIEPEPVLAGLRLDIPGDLSGAAFFMVGAALVPGSAIRLPGVGLNKRRRVLVDYLQRAGMDVKIENESEGAGEARGDIHVCYNADFLCGKLPPIHGELSAALIDEIPVLAVLGSQAGGVEIRDAGELRVKESDRIAAVASGLRAMGGEALEHADGLSIAGGQKLHGAEMDTRGDHRIALAFSVAALAAAGETRLRGADCANVSFPGFYALLEHVRRRE